MRYIALLRGINVGGHKKIVMADLKALFQEMGFNDVHTYIQSGNIVFSSSQKANRLLEQSIEKHITRVFGFDVPVLVRTQIDLSDILEKSPFKDLEDIASKKIYFVFFKTPPEYNTLVHFNQHDYPNEDFVIRNDYGYLNCTLGAGKAKLTNAIIEKKLKLVSTIRNYRTLVKLVEMAGGNR